MNAELTKRSVLVINRYWQAVNEMSPKKALEGMFSETLTGMIRAGRSFAPVKWRDWLSLAVGEGEPCVLTVRGPVRIPRLVIASRFAAVPLVHKKFSSRAVKERDRYTCQYCSQRKSAAELNIDHVVARKKKGATNWENVVCSCIPCNSRKGCKTLEEAGMRPIRKPTAPRPLPLPMFLDRWHGLEEFQPFFGGIGQAN